MSLVGYSLWGHTELDMAEESTHAQQKEPRKKSKELNTFLSLLKGNGEYVNGHSCKTFSDLKLLGHWSGYR